MAYPQSNRRRAAQRVAVLLIASGVIGAGTASADPRRPVLDPTLDCALYPVVSGDTLSAIARRNGLTLPDLLARNPHLAATPDRIYPQDQVVIRCAPKADTRPAPSSTVAEPPTTTAIPQPEAAMQRIEKPAPVLMAWPQGIEFIPGEQIVNGVVSQALVLRALYGQGARGNMLIGLAAVTEYESNRHLGSEGDQHLMGRDKTGTDWTESIGVWQIRSDAGKRGTGDARDADALRGDLEHQAWAAIQVYNGKLAAGRDPLSAWTCHLLGNDRIFVEPYRQLAESLGMLR